MIYRTAVSDVPIKDKITQMRLLMKFGAVSVVNR